MTRGLSEWKGIFVTLKTLPPTRQAQPKARAMARQTGIANCALMDVENIPDNRQSQPQVVRLCGGKEIKDRYSGQDIAACIRHLDRYVFPRWLPSELRSDANAWSEVRSWAAVSGQRRCWRCWSRLRVRSWRVNDRLLRVLPSSWETFSAAAPTMDTCVHSRFVARRHADGPGMSAALSS